MRGTGTRTDTRSAHMAGLLVALCVVPQAAWAGAWVLDPGAWQVITTADFYRTDTFITPDGTRQAAPEYRQVRLNPYVEYGWTPDWTVGASASIESVRQQVPGGGEVHNLGLGDTEIFARRLLWQHEAAVLSVQPLLKLPTGDGERRFPPIGNDDTDLELRALAGQGFAAGFINGEVAYRHRLGDPQDQWRVDLTGGYRPAEHWQVLAQAFGTFSVTTATQSATAIAPANDYDLAKMQLSAVYDLNSRTAVQAGVYAPVYARNTGEGEGAILAVWRRF